MDSSNIYSLVMAHGPQPRQRFILNALIVSVGRDPENHIPILDPEISRRHARFVWVDGAGYAVEDVGSTNGTFVNGQEIKQQTGLQHNDIVALGEAIELRYTVELRPEPKPTTRLARG